MEPIQKILRSEQIACVKSVKDLEPKKGFVIPYDEVWVIFDLEDLHDVRRKQAAEAMRMKEARNLIFGISDPAFEYWLLLHKEYTTKPFDGPTAVIRQLKNHWKDYTKGAQLPQDFLEKIPDAVSRAEKCRSHHIKSNGDGNPSTSVDILTRSLNSATRPHLQFRLQ